MPLSQKIALSLLVFFISACAKPTVERMQIEEAPADVQFAALDVIGEGVIERVERRENDSRTWYVIEYSNSGVVNVLYITPAGQLLSDDPGNVF